MYKLNGYILYAALPSALTLKLTYILGLHSTAALKFDYGHNELNLDGCKNDKIALLSTY